MIDIDNFPQYYDHYCGDPSRLVTGNLHDIWGSHMFIEMAVKYLNEKTKQTVKVGGKTHEMTLLRWIKRLEKTARAEINRERRARKQKSLRDTDNRYYRPQPVAHHLKPLHLDSAFLNELKQAWTSFNYRKEFNHKTKRPRIVRTEKNQKGKHWLEELEQLRVWAYLEQ